MAAHEGNEYSAAARRVQAKALQNNLFLIIAASLQYEIRRQQAGPRQDTADYRGYP